MKPAAKRETRFARHVFSELCETSSKLFSKMRKLRLRSMKSTLHAGTALAKCKMREAKAKEIKVKIDEPTGS